MKHPKRHLGLQCVATFLPCSMLYTALVMLYTSCFEIRIPRILHQTWKTDQAPQLFFIQMHYSLTMHNITSFLDKRMYSNAASECSRTGACKVCASPAVMAQKQPRCVLRWKFFTSRSMTLCFGGWHFEFWDDHTSIHLGTCFGRFENEVNKRHSKKHSYKRQASKRIKRGLKRYQNSKKYSVKE